MRGCRERGLGWAARGSRRSSGPCSSRGVGLRGGDAGWRLACSNRVWAQPGGQAPLHFFERSDQAEFRLKLNRLHCTATAYIHAACVRAHAHACCWLRWQAGGSTLTRGLYFALLGVVCVCVLCGGAAASITPVADKAVRCNFGALFCVAGSELRAHPKNKAANQSK